MYRIQKWDFLQKSFMLLSEKHFSDYKSKTCKLKNRKFKKNDTVINIANVLVH